MNIETFRKSNELLYNVNNIGCFLNRYENNLFPKNSKLVNNRYERKYDEYDYNKNNKVIDTTISNEFVHNNIKIGKGVKIGKGIKEKLPSIDLINKIKKDIQKKVIDKHKFNRNKLKDYKRNLVSNIIVKKIKKNNDPIHRLRKLAIK